MLEIGQLSNLDAWLRAILWNSQLPGTTMTSNSDRRQAKFEIHRLKARLVFSNGETKIVQGVREVFEILDAPNSRVCNSFTLILLKSRPSLGDILTSLLLGRFIDTAEFSIRRQGCFDWQIPYGFAVSGKL